MQEYSNVITDGGITSRGSFERMLESNDRTVKQRVNNVLTTMNHLLNLVLKILSWNCTKFHATETKHNTCCICCSPSSMRWPLP